MRVSPTTVIVVIACLFASFACEAKRAAAKLKTVPVAKLVKNVEAKLKEKPDDPDLLFQLARIHAMAYARKATKLEVNKGQDTPWFGYVPKGLPYKVNQSDDKEDVALANAHLKKALALHKKIIALRADHYLAHLGLAWCTEQAGKKKEAIKLYRILIKEALPKDRKIRGRWHGQPTVSTEASNHLIKLLDPKADADEIAKLTKQSQETESRIPRKM